MAKKRILIRKSQLNPAQEKRFKQCFPSGIPSQDLRKIPLGNHKRSLGVEWSDGDHCFLVVMDDFYDRERQNSLEEWVSQESVRESIPENILEDSEELGQFEEMDAWQRFQKHDFMEDNS